MSRRDAAPDAATEGAHAFDHLPFGVRDVDAARADLVRLGFTTTATGVCRWTLRGRASEARAISVVLAHGYLDLIEMSDPSWSELPATSPLFARGIAPSGIVLGADEPNDARAALAARGVRLGSAYEITRQVPGAAPAEMRYEIFPLREPELPFAFIRDHAPAAMRTAQWLRHDNTACGIRRLHLRAPSLSGWRARAALVFGPSPTPAELDLGRTTAIVHEEPREGWLAAVSRLLPRGERTVALAVEILVGDLDAVRSALERGGLAFSEPDDAVAVEPSAGYGLGILFRAASGRETSDAAPAIGR